MTEHDWMKATDPAEMLEFVRLSGRASERKLRLFACACGRRIWHLLTDERSRKAVEVAERFADGLADAEELADAREGADAVLEALDPGPLEPLQPEDYPAIHAAEVAQSVLDADLYEEGVDSIQAAASGAAFAAGSVGEVENTDPRESQAQANLLRDILGPLLFRSLPALQPRPGGVILQLAQAVYDNPILPGGTLDPVRLAVLADALEEMGADTELMAHLRGPGSHARGCFVVDWLLGKG